MSRIGIIGGSGLYNIPDLDIIEKLNIETPFGSPSDELTIGKLKGKEVVFLPRHGKCHRILPSELNYKANIYAMKKLDVSHIISVSACGSFKTKLKPRDLVIVTQFFDRTNQSRKTTFFGKGVVGHIAFSEPVCPDLSNILYEKAQQCGITVHKGGTYLNMEGPAFSTRAESKVYKSWGMDVIGMTNMAEARLAREAEICYATAAFVTDYDAWHESEEPVTVEMIIDNLNFNVDNSKKLLAAVIPAIMDERTCLCKDGLKCALLTRTDNIPAKTKEDLSIIIGKYLK